MSRERDLKFWELGVGRLDIFRNSVPSGGREGKRLWPKCSNQNFLDEARSRITIVLPQRNVLKYACCGVIVEIVDTKVGSNVSL